MPNWEPAQGGIARYGVLCIVGFYEVFSCWSGVVSQLCGSSSHLWLSNAQRTKTNKQKPQRGSELALDLPLVSMFAYDPVPDSES